MVANHVQDIKRSSENAAKKYFRPNSLQIDIIRLMKEMGYDGDVVARLLEENDISDVQEAIDMYEDHRDGNDD